MTYAYITNGPSPADHFTIMANAALRDPRLSFKAIGILARLRSHRDGQPVSIERLAESSADGRTAVLAGVRELEKFGYLYRARETDSEGRFAGWRYEVSDVPAPDFPSAGNLHRGTAGNPPEGGAENLPPIEDQTTEDQEKTKPRKKRAAPAPPEQPSEPTPNQVANKIARAYCDRLAMTTAADYHRTRQACLAALSAGHSPAEVEQAVKTIEAEGRFGVSIQTMRIQLTSRQSQAGQMERLFDENGDLRPQYQQRPQ